MIYLTIVSNRVITHGHREIETLIEIAKRDLPIGQYGYRIISKQSIYRFEVYSPENYILIFTNCPITLHNHLSGTFTSQIDHDLQDIESDSETEYTV